MPAAGLFQIRDVTRWPTEADEQMGSKRKVWLESPGRCSYLFKYVRRDKLGARVYGDDWAEKLAAELARLLGVPAAEVDLSEREGKPGVICRRINNPGVVELAHGNELLGARTADYDVELMREHPHYTIEAVQGCLASTAAPAGHPDLDAIGGFGVWAGFLVFDAWIANTDRHHENWGALIDRRDGSIRLAPSFDHGTSLGFNTSAATMARAVDDRQALDQWCRRGRSGHFAGRPSLVSVAAEALARAGSTAEDHWLARLEALHRDDWEAVIDRVPRTRMSEQARTFVGTLLETNRRRLLDVRHRAA